MKRWHAMRLVAAREVRERTRSRTFKIGLIITILLVVGFVVGPALIGTNKTPTFTVGIAEPSSTELKQSIVDTHIALGLNIEVKDEPDSSTGELELRSGAIDLLVVPNKEIVTNVAIDPTVTTNLARVAFSVNDVARLYSGLAKQGLDATASSRALNSNALSMRGLQLAQHRNSKGAVGASGATIILFVFLTLYGAWILNGVIEEKTSRVVEVLLSTVRADELLIGKVVGIGIVGSIQGLVIVAATFAARSGAGSSGAHITPKVMAYSLLWFVLGFGMYSWAYACAGALVSRAEDAQNLVFPLQMPILASYVVGLLSTYGGPNIVLTVMSMIPLTAPLTMLQRMAADQAPLWQVAVSIGSCLLTAFLIMRLAITIFSGGSILRRGRRVKLSEALQRS